MDRTVLQIPLSPGLKTQATQAAEDMGFSSLQDVIRLFLKKLATKQIIISLEEAIPLSKKTEKRYAEMESDFQNGVKVFHADSVEELITQLHED